MDNKKPTNFDETQALSLLGLNLLKTLDAEIEYVKRFVAEKIRDLLANNEWKEQQEAEEPWLWSLEREKYRLKIAIIHARKGEHITGADLVFELKDRKILFVQSKRVGSDNRLHFNRFQLKKLTDLEAQINLGNCQAVISPTLQCYLPVFFKKAAFYHLIMKDYVRGQAQERFFHISEIEYVLGNRKSVVQDEFINSGLKQEEFDEMFWKCEIGGPDLKEETKRDVFRIYSLVTNKVVVWLHVELKS